MYIYIYIYIYMKPLEAKDIGQVIEHHIRGESVL
jgi:hypothetical protein